MIAIGDKMKTCPLCHGRGGDCVACQGQGRIAQVVLDREEPTS